MSNQKNVKHQSLSKCSIDPLTGWNRNGYCEHKYGDGGRHLVCAQMTDEFLEFSKGKGNDLITPNKKFDFPGLRANDRWCICADRYSEAVKAGKDPPLIFDATNVLALEWPSVQKALEINALHKV